MLVKRFLLLFFLVFIFSCNNSKKTVKDEQPIMINQSFKEIGFLKFKNDTVFIKSPNNTYVLCEKYISPDNLNPNILNEFFVYDLYLNKIIYEDKISGCEIKWYSDFELHIIKQKGIINSPNDNGKTQYIFNLKTKSKSNINN